MCRRMPFMFAPCAESGPPAQRLARSASMMNSLAWTPSSAIMLSSTNCSTSRCQTTANFGRCSCVYTWEIGRRWNSGCPQKRVIQTDLTPRTGKLMLHQVAMLCGKCVPRVHYDSDKRQMVASIRRILHMPTCMSRRRNSNEHGNSRSDCERRSTTNRSRGFTLRTCRYADHQKHYQIPWHLGKNANLDHH